MRVLCGAHRRPGLGARIRPVRSGPSARHCGRVPARPA